MAASHPTEPAHGAFPSTLAGVFPDFAVLHQHELEELSRCATGIDAIVQLLDADRLAEEVNRDADDDAILEPRLTLPQQSGLLSASTVLIDTIARIVDAHQRTSRHERAAREAYTLALVTGTLDRPEA